MAARTGVTTWLDVGSSGSYNFPGFRRYTIDSVKSRVYALLNISSIGLTGPSWELANIGYLDVPLGTDDHRGQPRRHRRRQGAYRFEHNARGVGIKALDIARELAEAVDLAVDGAYRRRTADHR